MNLTQQQIAQLLPFDKEKALKFPDFVYFKSGAKPQNDITRNMNYLDFNIDFWGAELRLFPHRKVELWLVEDEKGFVTSCKDREGVEVCCKHYGFTDLNQSVTVLIFDETLLNT